MIEQDRIAIGERRFLSGGFFGGVLGLLLVLSTPAHSDMDEFWQSVLHREHLAKPMDAEFVQFSSYDPGGSNEDYGNYHGTDEHGDHILCDVVGPGVLTHFWCTWSTVFDFDIWRIYVDDMETPVIDTTISGLFGHTPPFSPPLADTVGYSRFSYVPIPFASHARVTLNGYRNNLYYHVDAFKFPPGTPVEPFALPTSPDYQSRLDSLAAKFQTSPQIELSGEAALSVATTETVESGEEAVLSYVGSGTCRRIQLRLDNYDLETVDSVWVDVFVDGYPVPVMSGPVNSLFGAALGWHPYQSSIVGTDGDSLYFALPIPFRTGLQIVVRNGSDDPRAVAIRAEIVAQAAECVFPYRLQAVYAAANPTLPWVQYVAGRFSGPGNYVGILWEMRDSRNKCLEGDISLYADHPSMPVWFGTGTEDYFNGAYYWQNAQQQTEPYQLPSHGLIHFQAAYSAAAYRWHLVDPVPFLDSFRAEIEVGGYGNEVGDYRSTILAYARIPRWRVIDESGDGRSCPQEPLRLLGYGLTPGDTLAHVWLDTQELTILPGTHVVDADSILDATAIAPTSAGSVLIGELGGEIDTVAREWVHGTTPSVSFTRLRPDIDSLVFSKDTLLIELHGGQPFQSADIAANGQRFRWAGSDSLADAEGVIRCPVMVPQGLPSTDLELRASVVGRPDAVAENALKHRSFIRYEHEEMRLASWQGTKCRLQWAPGWTGPPGASYPWGRDVVRMLSTEQAGDSITVEFALPDSGTFQTAYFLGDGSGTGIIRSTIDGLTDLSAYDSYRPGLVWRIQRSDTIRGVSRFLNAGTHSLTLSVVDRNPNSSDYDIWSDQVLLFRVPSAPADSVVDLTLSPDPPGVVLNWSATPGADYYLIYCRAIPDSVSDSGTLLDSVTVPQFVDPNALAEQDRCFYVVIAGRE